VAAAVVTIPMVQGPEMAALAAVAAGPLIPPTWQVSVVVEQLIIPLAATDLLMAIQII
jgi:hypothetical protein